MFGRSKDMSDDDVARDVVKEFIPHWTGFCVKENANENVETNEVLSVLEATKQVENDLSNSRIQKHGTSETVRWDHGKFSFAKVG